MAKFRTCCRMFAARLMNGCRSFRRTTFCRDQRGSVATIFGLSCVLLFGLVCDGVDYTWLTSRKNQMQATVDAGVLAAGNTLKLAPSSVEAAKGVTTQNIRDVTKPQDSGALMLRIEVPQEETSVSARAEATVSPSFGAFVGVGTTKVTAQARAGNPLDPVLEAADLISGNTITPTPLPLGATAPTRTYRITSNNAHMTLGTICLPAGRLVIDADKPVADESA